jgi:cytidyltransferase-like protein
MKGLYFGTFNPIHVGHLIIANHMAENDLEQVWLVVTPHNPHKKKEPCSMIIIDCKWYIWRLRITQNSKRLISNYRNQIIR